MITKEQIFEIAKKEKINETVIFREYLQLLFLNKLYSHKQSRQIFFKGGTAIRLIYNSPRFSEDLDFTVMLKEKDFLDFIQNIFQEMIQEGHFEFKERKTVTGKRFLLTAFPQVLPYKTFINLDFSFREKILQPQVSTIKAGDYPILFTSYIYHPSKEEIFAEKIRAVMTRRKGRDIYDLWYLLTLGTTLEKDLVEAKLKYYKLEGIKKEQILKRIESFPEKDFILDLRPFVPLPQREKLKEFYKYVQLYFKEHLL